MLLVSHDGRLRLSGTRQSQGKAAHQCSESSPEVSATFSQVSCELNPEAPLQMPAWPAESSILTLLLALPPKNGCLPPHTKMYAQLQQGPLIPYATAQLLSTGKSFTGSSGAVAATSCQNFAAATILLRQRLLPLLLLLLLLLLPPAAPAPARAAFTAGGSSICTNWCINTRS